MSEEGDEDPHTRPGVRLLPGDSTGKRTSTASECGWAEVELNPPRRVPKNVAGVVPVGVLLTDWAALVVDD